jgi:YfiH family protein
MAATLKQVHSDTVVRAGRETGCLGEGDALITDEPGLRLVIRTADCVPVLLADPERKAVAAVHAGWRGTAASVVAKTVERMRQEFGSAPEHLVAAIGPSIGACCYEVGPDVAERFTTWFPELQSTAGQPASINLSEANRQQLLQCGVTSARVIEAGLCTYCEYTEFHSFRRDKERSGRMESWIAISV